MYEFADDMSEKRLDSIDHGRTKSFSQFWNTEGGSGYSDLTAIVNPRILKSIYMSEDWIFILVDKIASKLAQIPWQVHKDIKPGGEQVLEPALDHPVQKILDTPNPLQPSYAFKYSCITDLSVTGNCLIYFSRQNRWLVQVPTEIVSLDITGRGDLRGYDIVGIDPMAFPVGMRTKLKPQDVIHTRRPNPSSVFWGLSPLIPGANPSLFNKYSNEYLLNFYRKGAQPGLILEMGDEANENQARKLLSSLETAYTGRANQRRGLVMPKGVKVNQLTHSIADQQLQDLIRNNRETLINIFGVPKHELSIAEAGSLGSEEYKTALKNFWQGPLMSIGSMFESSMTEKLKPLLGENYVIKLNYSGIPVLQEDLLEKANLASSMLSTMTYNEVRQKVWKLPPIEGGDIVRDLQQPAFPSFPAFSSEPQSEPLASFSLDEEEDDGSDFEFKAIPQKYEHINYKPVDDVADEARIGLEWRKKYGRGGTEVGVARATQLKNKRTVSPDTIKRMVSYFARHAGEGDNKENNGEPSAGAIAWKLWGGDPGERWSNKINEQMNSADEKENKDIKENNSDEKDYKQANIEAFSTYLKAENGSWLKDQISSIDEESKKKQSALEKLWIGVLSKQIARAVSIAKDQMNEKAATLPNKTKLKKDIEKAMKDLEKQWIDGYTDTLQSQFEIGYNSVIEIPFNKPYIEGIEEIQKPGKNKTRSILEKRGLESFANMSRTTTESIMRTIERGMEESQTIQDIAKNIKDIASVSAGRAMTIARTETLVANSLGESLAREAAAEYIPKMVKVWINANDDRVRGNPSGEYPDSKADHWSLMGEIVDQDEKFSNGLDFPRDPRGDAGEVINCRCSILAVSEDDLPQLGLSRAGGTR